MNTFFKSTTWKTIENSFLRHIPETTYSYFILKRGRETHVYKMQVTGQSGTVEKIVGLILCSATFQLCEFRQVTWILGSQFPNLQNERIGWLTCSISALTFCPLSLSLSSLSHTHRRGGRHRSIWKRKERQNYVEEGGRHIEKRKVEGLEGDEGFSVLKLRGETHLPTINWGWRERR